MFAYRWRPSMVSFGEIDAGRAFRATGHRTPNETRHATRFSTWFATRFCTCFATCFVTIGNNLQQNATMFVRASFACSKVFQDNGIRRWHRTRSVGQMAKLWKNVEILTQARVGVRVVYDALNRFRVSLRTRAGDPRSQVLGGHSSFRLGMMIPARDDDSGSGNES